MKEVSCWRNGNVKVLDGEDLNRILNTGADILDLQVGVIILDDLRKGKTLSHQFKDILNGNARAGHARLAKMDIGVDGNPVGHLFTLVVPAVT